MVMFVKKLQFRSVVAPEKRESIKRTFSTEKISAEWETLASDQLTLAHSYLTECEVNIQDIDMSTYFEHIFRKWVK